MEKLIRVFFGAFFTVMMLLLVRNAFADGTVGSLFMVIGIISIVASVIVVFMSAEQKTARGQQKLVSGFLLLVLGGFGMIFSGPAWEKAPTIGCLIIGFFFLLGAGAVAFQWWNLRGTEHMTDEEVRELIEDGQNRRLCEIIEFIPMDPGYVIRMQTYEQVADTVFTFPFRLYSESDHFMTDGVYKTGALFTVSLTALEAAEIKTPSAGAEGQETEMDVTGIDETCFKRAGVLEKLLFWTVRKTM